MINSLYPPDASGLYYVGQPGYLYKLIKQFPATATYFPTLFITDRKNTNLFQTTADFMISVIEVDSICKFQFINERLIRLVLRDDNYGNIPVSNPSELLKRASRDKRHALLVHRWG